MDWNVKAFFGLLAALAAVGTLVAIAIAQSGSSPFTN